jgi:hypothetical protein
MGLNPFADDFDWKEAAATLIGGPPGYVGYKGYRQREAGNAAAQAGMADARTRLEEMQKAQRGQRQQDLTRALGYFGPVNATLKQMYGTSFPSPIGGTQIPQGMQTDRSGIGHFVSPGQRTGGSAPPPPPPPTAAGAAARFNGSPLPPGQSYGLGGNAGQPAMPPQPRRQSVGKGYYR